MFSPYYARAQRRAGGTGADPTNHCALNVALYGVGGARWAMTERGRGQLRRDAMQLQIGPSALRWVGNTLHIEIDEIGVPWPTRLRGEVRLHAPQRFGHVVELAPGHAWCPIAPAARVEVDLGSRRWSGPAYLDTNRGDAPLESAFGRWDWARAQLANGDSIVFYDVERLKGEPLAVALRYGADGRVTPVASPPVAPLPATLWRIPRRTRSDEEVPARLMQTLTDAPFYARSLLEAQWFGERVTAVHESLSLKRFDSAWVQAMLPFRMPRRAGA